MHMRRFSILSMFSDIQTMAKCKQNSDMPRLSSPPTQTLEQNVALTATPGMSTTSHILVPPPDISEAGGRLHCADKRTGPPRVNGVLTKLNPQPGDRNPEGTK